jgi:GTP cyclohydrolase II
VTGVTSSKALGDSKAVCCWQLNEQMEDVCNGVSGSGVVVIMKEALRRLKNEIRQMAITEGTADASPANA